MSEPKPKLSVFREVKTNLIPSFELIRNESKALRISKTNARYFKKESNKVHILTKAEVYLYLESVGVHPTVELLEDLADYLLDSLLDTVDDTLEVPTYPIGVYLPVAGRRNYIFTFGTSDAEIKQERDDARALVETFIGRLGVATASEFAWPNEPWVNEIRVATLRDDRKARIFRAMLDEIGVLMPNTIEYGPAVIEDLVGEEEIELGTLSQK